MVPKKPPTIANTAVLLSDDNLIDILPMRDTDLSSSNDTGKEYKRLEVLILSPERSVGP